MHSRLILSAVLGAALLMPGLALGQEAVDSGRRRRQVSVLSVSGRGEVRVKPDMATVNFGVQTRASTADEAQASTNKLMTATIDAIKKMGIEAKNIQTKGISLRPIYPPRKPGSTELPKIIGYDASNQISVRVENIKRVGQVIDVGLAGGANQFQGVSFGLRERDAATQKALTKAVRQARAKAKTIAEALGVKLDGVQDVSEGGISLPQPRYFAGVELARKAVSTPVQPGELTVSAQVTIRYRLAGK